MLPATTADPPGAKHRRRWGSSVSGGRDARLVMSWNSPEICSIGSWSTVTLSRSKTLTARLISRHRLAGTVHEREVSVGIRNRKREAREVQPQTRYPVPVSRPEPLSTAAAIVNESSTCRRIDSILPHSVRYHRQESPRPPANSRTGGAPPPAQVRGWQSSRCSSMNCSRIWRESSTSAVYVSRGTSSVSLREVSRETCGGTRHRRHAASP